MEPVTIIAGGVLLLGGFLFAVFLGVAAEHIEEHRYDDQVAEAD